jgi:hypothetical protein
LERLQESGKRFKVALGTIGKDQPLSNAETIVTALSELRPDLVHRFYRDKLDHLRQITPLDPTGYLGFIDMSTELSEMENKLYDRFLTIYEKWSAGHSIKSPWITDITLLDVDSIIEKHKPRGVTLQAALLARAFLEIDSAQWQRALATFDMMGTIESTPSRFERARPVSIRIRSPVELRSHISAANRLSDNPLAQLRALYAILRGDIECVTPTSCCNHSFTLLCHQIVAGAAYGELLLASTAHLQGQERAAAIGQGLEEIDLFSNGSIGRLVRDVLPSLVGKEEAKRLLPPRYAKWLHD